MSNQAASIFAFHPSIDTQSLTTLYGSDYLQIQVIFNIVVSQFDEDLSAIQKAYSQNDLESLKRAVHKIKPVFGFVGLPGILEACKVFESTWF